MLRMLHIVSGILLTFCLLLPSITRGQQSFRVKANFTIKQKTASGEAQLIMGQVYYDKTIKQIIYIVKFPEKETWVINDTAICKLIEDTVKSVQKTASIAEFSIFHLCLNGNLSNYGLDHKDSFYKIDKVEKEEDMVITTWLPDAKLSEVFGKVVISNKKKKLYGIVFFSPKGELLNKQVFKNYTNTNGCEFPTEIIKIAYKEGRENYEITTFNNIIIDDLREDNIYNYTFPK